MCNTSRAQSARVIMSSDNLREASKRRLQRTVANGSPTSRRTINAQSASLRETRRDLRENISGKICLAVSVIAPTPNRAIRSQSANMHPSRCNLRERFGGRGQRPWIETPTSNRALVAERTGIIEFFRRRDLREFPSGRRRSTKKIISSTSDCTIGAQSAKMFSPRRKLFKGSIGWRGLISIKTSPATRRTIRMESANMAFAQC
jgi:hypothetical protein